MMKKKKKKERRENWTFININFLASLISNKIFNSVGCLGEDGFDSKKRRLL
jgi:hypothetical protein